MVYLCCNQLIILLLMKIPFSNIGRYKVLTLVLVLAILGMLDMLFHTKYLRKVIGLENPRIGLANIGTEEGYGLGIGGIERCLINLLNVLDTSRYEIDVLPMNPEWDLLPNLRANVTVLQPFDYVMNTTDTIKEFKSKKKGLNLYLRYIAYRVINKWGKKPWKLFKAPEKEYDVAIAYAHIGYVPYYVIDCIHAKKKYMWHHEGRYLKDVQYSLDKEYYSQFNALVAVSNDDRNVLVEAFPNLENHIKVLYNVLDREDIREKSLESCSFNYLPGVLKLATVGRLTHQKGPDLLLQIASI